MGAAVAQAGVVRDLAGTYPVAQDLDSVEVEIDQAGESTMFRFPVVSQSCYRVLPGLKRDPEPAVGVDFIWPRPYARNAVVVLSRAMGR